MGIGFRSLGRAAFPKKNMRRVVHEGGMETSRMSVPDTSCVILRKRPAAPFPSRRLFTACFWSYRCNAGLSSNNSYINPCCKGQISKILLDGEVYGAPFPDATE